MNFLTLSRHALVWSTRSLVWMGLVAVLLVGVAVVGGWLVQSTLSLQKSQDTPPGKMVAAEGEWVHLLCVGRPEAPVIFLESGAMGWSSIWSWFYRHAGSYRMCSWDRPGMGWSQPSQRPADGEASMRLLHEVLSQEGINQKPFVFVGHSLGGLHGLIYQRLFPEDVSALVLVDPAHPQQLQRLPEATVQKTFNQVDRLYAALPLLDLGVGRGLLETRRTSVLYRLPEYSLSEVLLVSSSRQHLDRSVQEYLSWGETARSTMKSNSLDIPLLILSASDREQGNREANVVWWTLHREMSSLSSKGRWVVIPDTSHQSIVMKEDSALLTLEQIKQTHRESTKKP